MLKNTLVSYCLHTGVCGCRRRCINASRSVHTANLYTVPCKSKKLQTYSQPVHGALQIWKKANTAKTTNIQPTYTRCPANLKKSCFMMLVGVCMSVHMQAHRPIMQSIYAHYSALQIKAVALCVRVCVYVRTCRPFNPSSNQHTCVLAGPQTHPALYIRPLQRLGRGQG